MASTDRSDNSRSSNKSTRSSHSVCNMEAYIEQYEEIYGRKLTGQVQAALEWYKEYKDQRTSINKLSFRKRCRLTPNFDKMKSREMSFINDAITTEKRRTKYKDIIPPYTANKDSHCQAYFKRPDIKRLLNVTCSPR